MSNDKTEQPIPASRKLTTVSQIVEWIDREIADHDKAFPNVKPSFVNGAMMSLKNLLYFIDTDLLPPSPVGEEECCTCLYGPTDANPNCKYPDCVYPPPTPSRAGEISPVLKELKERIEFQLKLLPNESDASSWAQGKIAAYKQVLEWFEEAPPTPAPEVKKVDNNVIPIREPELIPSESNAYVTMADGSRSRTLGELFQLIPQVHRKQIMGATGPGTSLCAVLEYVVRYGEEIRSQCNQQREDVKEELEQVKLSFHQAVEEVKRLTAQVPGK